MSIATYQGTEFTAVYICREWAGTAPEPWTPYELTRQMIAVGWQPLPEPGHYRHTGTGYEMDINAPDKHGDPVWISWAVARMTPPPF